MGVYDLTQINTVPGNDVSCPFSPPAGWEGGSDDYLSLMRQRYNDKAFSQLIGAAARTSKSLEMHYSGPFAKQAAQIINKLQ